MEYLGIDIGGTTTKMGVVTNNEIKNVTIFNTDKNIEKFLSVLIQKINLYKLEFKIQAIGIGVPGFIDMNENIIKICPNLGWKDVYITEKISKNVNLPVYLINDVTRCMSSRIQIWFFKKYKKWYIYSSWNRNRRSCYCKSETLH